VTLPANTALRVIDVQQGLDDPSWGERNNPGAERNIAALLAAWRRTRPPVIHVQHMSVRPELEAHLRTRGINCLVLVGLTTDHCVSSTARMAANLGFSAIVVSDGTATFERTGPEGDHHTAEQMHRLALASLHEEFATVRRTGEVLAEAGSPG
jgi:nicotinamidase-related amidase